MKTAIALLALAAAGGLGPGALAQKQFVPTLEILSCDTNRGKNAATYPYALIAMVSGAKPAKSVGVAYAAQEGDAAWGSTNCEDKLHSGLASTQLVNWERADKNGDSKFRFEVAKCEQYFYQAVSAPHREEQCALSDVAHLAPLEGWHFGFTYTGVLPTYDVGSGFAAIFDDLLDMDKGKSDGMTLTAATVKRTTAPSGRRLLSEDTILVGLEVKTKDFALVKRLMRELAQLFDNEIKGNNIRNNLKRQLRALGVADAKNLVLDYNEYWRKAWPAPITCTPDEVALYAHTTFSDVCPAAGSPTSPQLLDSGATPTSTVALCLGGMLTAADQPAVWSNDQTNMWMFDYIAEYNDWDTYLWQNDQDKAGPYALKCMAWMDTPDPWLREPGSSWSHDENSRFPQDHDNYLNESNTVQLAACDATEDGGRAAKMYPFAEFGCQGLLEFPEATWGTNDSGERHSTLQAGPSNCLIDPYPQTMWFTRFSDGTGILPLHEVCDKLGWQFRW